VGNNIARHTSSQRKNYVSVSDVLDVCSFRSQQQLQLTPVPFLGPCVAFGQEVFWWVRVFAVII